MKMRLISILCAGSMDGPVAAVQDHFGSAYRCLTRAALPGSVILTGLNPHEGEVDMRLACNIVKRVNAATVRNLLKGSRYERLPLARGVWHEVRGE